MNTYTTYQPTNIAWLGDIPSHWEISKLGRMLTPFSEKNHAHLPLLSITREQGVIMRDVENQDENHNFIPDDLSNYKLLKKGQFGMNKMKAWQGSYGVSAFTGIVSPAYFIFDFTKEINPDFFHWAIRSKLYVSFFASASDGVRIGQWDLSKSRMKNIPFVIPPLAEQTAIAEFLDKKTAQIQTAIRLKSEQIATLKEYRQALINQTVTQGLNPSVPMKNSGIEWLGDVPEHWEVKKLKFVADIVLGKMLCTENKGGFFLKPYLKSKNIQWLNLDLSSVDEMWFSNYEMDLYRLKKGDLIVSEGGEVGKTCMWNEELKECYIQNSAHKVRFNNKNSSKYFLYVFFTYGYLGVFNSIVSRVSIAHLTKEKLSNIEFPIPPLTEQTAIADYLDVKTAQIDTALATYQAQIDKLNEYQRSLVNDVVTGKIDVRTI